jgi:hypothetical protein
MTHDAWDRLNVDEKLDYLFRHSDATEQALQRLSASVQYLHERLRKIEAVVAENAA